MPRPTKQEFEDMVMPEPNSGCWIWMKSVWKTTGGTRGKLMADTKWWFAYRMSYTLFKGDIPSGLCGVGTRTIKRVLSHSIWKKAA